ncbi:Sec-independent protein translocase protein TatB [Nocardioidaceae bacterium]|nr:Sec-independent protein translocase protein TatB [Nocardioidaceae bacterium]
MLGVGFSEFVVLLVVGLVVFGPDRLPEFARTAGRTLRRVKEFSDSARDELRNELGPDFADFEFEDLDPRKVVRKQLSGAWEGVDRDTEALPRGMRPLKAGQRPPYDDEAT